jgi:hypothetical protein
MLSPSKRIRHQQPKGKYVRIKILYAIASTAPQGLYFLLICRMLRTLNVI